MKRRTIARLAAAMLESPYKKITTSEAAEIVLESEGTRQDAFSLMQWAVADGWFHGTCGMNELQWYMGDRFIGARTEADIHRVMIEDAKAKRR